MQIRTSLYCIGFILTIISIGNTFGQSKVEVLPYSYLDHLPAIEEYEVIDSPPLQNLKTSDLEDIFIFATPIKTYFTPANSGVWTSSNFGRVWRIKIKSPGATSLYASLSTNLVDKARLYAYRANYESFSGPVQAKRNSTISLPLVADDELIIELNIPKDISPYGELQIELVYHGFQSPDSKNNRAHNPNEHVCFEDINCENGDNWQTQKKAVCKIITNGLIGTGTLIGNTNLDQTPYLLTSHHLIANEQEAASAIFLFNEETPACAEPFTSYYHAVSGASLVSTTDGELDFTLLELNTIPPAHFQPFYAGWTISTNPAWQVATLHHALGEPKQLAISYEPPVSESIGKGFDKNATWKVNQWDVGTTEPGSSGAALFNENQLIVGILSGGRATCGYPFDDYFTKLHVAWNAYDHPNRQLKTWLDPVNSNTTMLYGYDPYGFNSHQCVPFWNVEPHDLKHPSASQSNFQTLHMAEKFYPTGSIQIDEIYCLFEDLQPASPLAHFTVSIWTESSDGLTKIHDQTILMRDVLENEMNTIQLERTINLSNPFYVSLKVNPDDLLSVALFDHLPAIQGNSAFAMNDDGTISNLTKHTAALGIGVSECYGTFTLPQPANVTVFPNPSVNQFQLFVPDQSPIINLQCIDSSGKVRFVNWSTNEDGTVAHHDLPAGVYFLRIHTVNQQYQSRFLVD